MVKQLRWHLILTAILISLLLIDRRIGLIVISLTAAFGITQFNYLIRNLGRSPFYITGILSTIILIVSLYISLDTLTVGLTSVVVLWSTWLVADEIRWRRTQQEHKRDTFMDVALGMAGSLLIGFPLGLLLIIRDMPQATFLVLILILITSVYNLTSPYINKYFGEHPLMATINSDFTWEGLIVNILVSTGIAFFLLKYFDIPLVQGLALSYTLLIATIYSNIIENKLLSNRNLEYEQVLTSTSFGLLHALSRLCLPITVTYFYVALFT